MSQPVTHLNVASRRNANLCNVCCAVPFAIICDFQDGTSEALCKGCCLKTHPDIARLAGFEVESK